MNTLSASKANIKKVAKRKKRLVVLCFLAPNLFGFFAFTILPIFSTLLISLTKWNLLSSPKWIGLGNYANLIGNARFYQVLANTAYYTFISVPIGIMLAIFLATLMNTQYKKINTFFRIIYYLPVISSTVAVALIWKYIYADDFGLLSYLFKSIGIEAPKFITSTKWSLNSVIVMSIWKSLGYNIILILAGLQGIGVQYYEAAKIDGASSFMMFWKITLPMLSPTIFFVTIMSFIGSFQVFDQTKILTDGGPGYSSTSLVFYIYTQGFKNLQFGLACAMAILLFILVLVISLIQWKAQKRWVVYDV